MTGYDDEDIYDQVQDARILISELAGEPLPEPVARTIEGSLLSVGDLIVLPEPEQWGLEPGTSATVGRVFPFQGGATVECELEDGREVQAIVYDDPRVVLLVSAGTNAVPYVRWVDIVDCDHCEKQLPRAAAVRWAEEVQWRGDDAAVYCSQKCIDDQAEARMCADQGVGA